jgi:homoserine kinase type II
MKKIFIVWHIRTTVEEDDEIKFIGGYSSGQAAEDAIDRLKNKPGFRDYPEGFLVDAYEVGKDHWAEGFFTYYPPIE